MTTGEKIKYLRKQKGLTQEELGQIVGVQKAAINKYETGVVINIKRDIIAALAKALDVSPVYLLDDNSDGPVPDTPDLPQSPEARILAKGIDMLPPEQRAQALAVVRAMFAQHPEIFEEGNENK